MKTYVCSWCLGSGQDSFFLPCPTCVAKNLPPKVQVQTSSDNLVIETIPQKRLPEKAS